MRIVTLEGRRLNGVPALGIGLPSLKSVGRAIKKGGSAVGRTISSTAKKGIRATGSGLKTGLRYAAKPLPKSAEAFVNRNVRRGVNIATEYAIDNVQAVDTMASGAWRGDLKKFGKGVVQTAFAPTGVNTALQQGGKAVAKMIREKARREAKKNEGLMRSQGGSFIADQADNITDSVASDVLQRLISLMVPIRDAAAQSVVSATSAIPGAAAFALPMTLLAWDIAVGKVLKREIQQVISRNARRFSSPVVDDLEDVISRKTADLETYENKSTAEQNAIKDRLLTTGVTMTPSKEAAQAAAKAKAAKLKEAISAMKAKAGVTTDIAPTAPSMSKGKLIAIAGGALALFLFLRRK